MTSSNGAALQPFLARLLRHTPLDEHERAAILNLPFRTTTRDANRDVGRFGERPTHCCFVVDGLLARFGQDREGERQITALHIPGDMPDLHSAIRPAGIGGLTALTRTTILQVPHDEIRRRIADHPAIGEALWRDCLLDAAILTDWVINLGRRSARARLAHLFCEMSVRYAGHQRYLDQFRFPVTQQQLAEITALTSVHVNRSLRALREEGLVMMRSGEVVIPAWAKLAAAADFDPTYLVG